jgi:hypothetical protein
MSRVVTCEVNEVECRKVMAIVCGDNVVKSRLNKKINLKNDRRVIISESTSVN